MMKRRLAVVTSVAAIAGLGVSAAPAAADQKPSRWGLCGARNMVNPNALPGMMNAMGNTPVQGDTGMFGAVANTTCAPPEV
jgi:hypothetical protein